MSGQEPLPAHLHGGSAHLGQLLLQMAAVAVQYKELLFQGLPGLLSHTQGALQALPLHLLLQPQLLQPLLLLHSQRSGMLCLLLAAQERRLFLL